MHIDVEPSGDRENRQADPRQRDPLLAANRPDVTADQEGRGAKAEKENISGAEKGVPNLVPDNSPPGPNVSAAW